MRPTVAIALYVPVALAAGAVYVTVRVGLDLLDKAWKWVR